MAKYVCSICGYVYDESTGDPENGISAGTEWDNVIRDWMCPICGATKVAFEQDKVSERIILDTPEKEEEISEDLHELTFGELSALCSNLAKGCEKQYDLEEANLFLELSTYYQGKTKGVKENNIHTLYTSMEQDLNGGYVKAKEISLKEKDRGALRALIWSEKVTKILNSLLLRYEKDGDSAFENSNVFVCEICGFVYVGEKVPEVCPVCKVPKSKIKRIQRG